MPTVPCALVLRRAVLSIGCLALGVLFVLGRAAEPVQADRVPDFSHIFVVVLENKEIDRVRQNESAPFLNRLAADYGLATRYYAVSHPSLPNYLALLAGDTLGVADNCEKCFQAAPTLVDQLEAAGLTWKAYFESMPSPCYVGSTRDGLYVQKHNPFIYFDSIRNNPGRCGRIVPLGQLGADFDAGDIANLVWIGPNMDNSTHDGSIADGDAWLAAHIPAILNSPAFQENGLLVVTYDEGDSDEGCCGQRKGGGRIMTVLASPLSKRGFALDTPVSHYSLLRTIEDAWGLEHLGHAGDAAVENLAELFVQVVAP